MGMFDRVVTLAAGVVIGIVLCNKIDEKVTEIKINTRNKVVNNVTDAVDDFLFGKKEKKSGPENTGRRSPIVLYFETNTDAWDFAQSEMFGGSSKLVRNEYGECRRAVNGPHLWRAYDAYASCCKNGGKYSYEARDLIWHDVLLPLNPCDYIRDNVIEILSIDLVDLDSCSRG